MGILLNVCFNPCCAGCSSGSPIPCFSSSRLSAVSILVVLDVVLEEGNDPICPTCLSRFNPCCAGCSSGSWSKIIINEKRYIVSILVVLDVVLEGSNLPDKIPIISLFQSLLCWM